MATAQAGHNAQASARGDTAPRKGSATRKPGPLYAALDLGTNNCRLLLAAPRGRDIQVMGSFSRIVRLGEGLARTGRLADVAIERTLDALSVCAKRLEKVDATRVRCVATEACRKAANGPAFVRRALDETGIELIPISTREEAELTFSGCRGLVDSRIPHILVFDIGGGSTEVVWATNGKAGPEIEAVTSLPFGVVTLAERFGGAEMSANEYAIIVTEMMEGLAPFDAEHGIAKQVGHGAVQMIGTSGTVTTLGALTLGLPRYQRALVDGLELTFDQIFAANAFICAMGPEARARNACIGPERADLALGGCAVLEAICRLWPVGKLTIGDRGIREGLLHAMMAADTKASPGQTTEAPAYA